MRHPRPRDVIKAELRHLATARDRARRTVEALDQRINRLLDDLTETADH